MYEWEQDALKQITEALRASVIRDWTRALKHLKFAVDALEARCCNCGQPWRKD
jgi:hypothetical protein